MDSKINLTTAETLGISVSNAEFRMLKNLRRLAAEVVYGTLEVTFHVHNSELKTGEVGKTMVRI